MTHFRGLALVTLALATSACATSLAAGHTAKVLDKGHVEFSGTTGISVPIAAIERLYAPSIREVQTLDSFLQRGGKIALAPSTLTGVLVGATYLLAGLPQEQTEAMVRYGFAPGFDTAIRYSGSVFRFEVFGQALKGPWPIAIGLGASHRNIDHGVLGSLADLGLVSVQETDLDVTVLTGHKWKYGEIYFGPKLVYSSYDWNGSLQNGNMIAVNVNEATLVGIAQFDLSHSWACGMVIGGRATVGHWYITAEVGVYDTEYRPSVFGQSVGLGGLLVYPMGGVGTLF